MSWGGVRWGGWGVASPNITQRTPVCTLRPSPTDAHPHPSPKPYPSPLTCSIHFIGNVSPTSELPNTSSEARGAFVGSLQASQAYGA